MLCHTALGYLMPRHAGALQYSFPPTMRRIMAYRLLLSRAININMLDTTTEKPKQGAYYHAMVRTQPAILPYRLRSRRY